jgi:hypothetical protein
MNKKCTPIIAFFILILAFVSALTIFLSFFVSDDLSKILRRYLYIGIENSQPGVNMAAVVFVINRDLHDSNKIPVKQVLNE